MAIFDTLEGGGGRKNAPTGLCKKKMTLSMESRMEFIAFTYLDMSLSDTVGVNCPKKLTLFTSKITNECLMVNDLWIKNHT